MIKAFKHFKNRVVNCRRGGGSKTITSSAPAPQTTAESMADYVASLPALYDAQMEYDPKLVQQQLELLQTYGTQFGEATKATQDALYPETSAIQEEFAGQALEGSEQGLTPEEMAQYRDIYASELGTNAGSGVGANYMGSGLVQANIQRKDYYRNLGLTLAGRQPLSQGGVTGQSNWMQQYQANQGLQNNAQNYGNYANSFDTSYQASPWGDIAGSVIGGVGAAASGGLSEGGAWGSSKRFKKNIKLWE